MRQMSLFDGSMPYIIDKPIRLIEFFAGYGSQALSLKYLGANFEHHKISEWAIPSIIAYKDMHFPNDNTDYSKGLSREQIVDFLMERTVSANYNEPVKKEALLRYAEDKLRTIYNSLIATNNMGSVCNVTAKDLQMTDMDKYCYVWSYSFPCQDLSIAGKQGGMKKGGSTRSGLLWEIERLLNEAKQLNCLPNVLVMENVPEVMGTNNIAAFADWIKALDEMGYHSEWQVENSKDHQCPQNRDRCFMVSVLGDYYYTFPQKAKLEYEVNDLLEKNVDESYFLSSKQMIYAFDCNRVCDNTKRGDLAKRKVNPPIAKTISCRGATDQRADITNFVVGSNAKEYTLGQIRDMVNSKRKRVLKWRNRIVSRNDDLLRRECCDQALQKQLVSKGDVVDYSFSNSRLAEIKQGMIRKKNKQNNKLANTITTGIANMGSCVSENDVLRIRKFTPRECFRLMGVSNQDYDNVSKRQPNGKLYHLVGDSIVTVCLMAIFGAMLGVDYNKKISELMRGIVNGI